jgi:hypothetical protein
VCWLVLRGVFNGLGLAVGLGFYGGEWFELALFWLG